MAPTSVKKLLQQALSGSSSIPPTPQPLPAGEIGSGQCGIVFVVDSKRVFKTARPGKDDELANDHQSHLAVLEAFEKLTIKRPDISIPGDPQFVVPSQESFWPVDNLVRGNSIASERIGALPMEVREAIVECFLHASIKDKGEILADEKNRDCLVRVYLGSRERRPANPQNFSLRNFPLEINDMESLGMTDAADRFTRTMAQTLAILHWGAGIDADDVEFVLGMRPDANNVGLWLLDFNQCRKFSWEQDGLNQLVKAYIHNDPYYPRPVGTEKDQQRWKLFKKEYLRMTAASYGPCLEKANAFIEAAEKEAKKRFGGGNLFA